MSWTVESIPDLSGRSALVTGANGGVGLETAIALVGKGAHVIMAARNPDKAAAAGQIVRARHPEGSFEIRPLDLASLMSVKDLARSVSADFGRLDILVNNAGVMGIPQRRTADGFEMQFGVNHLGHYALTARLLPLLLRTPASRIVTVSSTARHFGRPLDPSDPHLEKRYDPWTAYSRSKLANVHFAVGLDRKLEAVGAATDSLAAHPGLSNTDLQSNSVRESGGLSQRFFEWLASNTGMTPARGALPQLRAATDPKASGGDMYAPRFGNHGAPVRRTLVGRATDQELIDVLFAVSERETGLSIDLDSTEAGDRT